MITPTELSELADAIADRLAERLASRPRLVDRNTLAQLLGVSVPTVDRLRADGRITPILLGSRVMYDPATAIAELSAGGGDDE